MSMASSGDSAAAADTSSMFEVVWTSSSRPRNAYNERSSITTKSAGYVLYVIKSDGGCFLLVVHAVVV